MLLVMVEKGGIGRKGLSLLQYIIKMADIVGDFHHFNVYIFWILKKKKTQL